MTNLQLLLCSLASIHQWEGAAQQKINLKQSIFI